VPEAEDRSLRYRIEGILLSIIFKKRYSYNGKGALRPFFNRLNDRNKQWLKPCCLCGQWRFYDWPNRVPPLITESIDYPRYEVEDWGGVGKGMAPIGSQ
jgi:hypothetical protein